jgi:hypothetical protein
VNPFFLVAALADVMAVVVHGYVGHRLIVARLTPHRLFSTSLFGNADRTRRVIVVTWHAVTAAFATSAVMMFVWSFGTVAGDSGPLFVSLMHVSFALVALVVIGRRIGALWRRPVPMAFATVMTIVALMGWLGSL